MRMKHVTTAGKRILALLVCAGIVFGALCTVVTAQNPPLGISIGPPTGKKWAQLAGSQSEGVYNVYLQPITQPGVGLSSIGGSLGGSSTVGESTVEGTVSVPVDHSYLTITDHMSQYVDFLPGTLRLMEKSGSGWKLSTDGTPNYQASAGANGVVTCTIQPYSSSKEYRLEYQVQVRMAFAGQRIHQEQTSGTSPAAGTDGLILNGLTTVETNYHGPQPINVPTGWRQTQVVHSKRLLIQKEDRATGDNLAGFTFELRDSGGKAVKSIVTDLDTDKNILSVDDFAPGSYTLWEAKVDPAYEIIKEQLAAIKVEESGGRKYFLITPSATADVSLATITADDQLLIVRNRKLGDGDHSSGNNWPSRPPYGGSVGGSGSGGSGSGSGSGSGNNNSGTTNIPDRNPPTSGGTGSGSGRLPSTGGFAIEILGVTGLALIGGGIWWKRRKAKKLPPADDTPQ